MPTTTPFNNLITFSRGSNATVTGSNGLIQWAPNNLLTFSEQFDNAAWQKFGGGVATAPAVTANAGVAPDGTTTADRIQFALNGGTTSTDRSLLSQSVTLATSFPYTYSIWVRSLSGILSMGIGCDNLVGNTPITVTTEWQRFTVSGTATGTAGVALLQLRGGQTPVQSNAADVLVWGAQLELGSTATTYNPTTVKNLLGFSEAFDNAAWTKSNSSIVTGAQANPVNGLFNAQKLMENTANTAHRVQQTVNISGAPITLSAYLKAGERTWAYLRLDDASSVKFAYFNLATGAAGFTTSGVTSSITSVGSGWYRCSITFAAPAATAIGTGVIGSTTADATSSNLGDGNSGVYIYGAQLSDSASLDPYVPTPGAAPSSTAFYGPRFDFDPVTLLPRGLLVEEQRTNLQTYSEDFANAAWTKSNTGTLLRNQVSPTGAANSATTLVADNAGGVGQVFVNQVFSTTSGTAYTMSAYFKQGTQRYAVVNIFNGFTNTSLWFDLQAGTFGVLAGSGATGSISNVGNGWYRCVVSATANATVGNAVFRLAIAENTTDVNYNTPRNGTSSILIFGAQVEAGAFATSYIPTIASTVTRSADVATITGQNFAQWYTGAQGTLAVEFSPGGINTVSSSMATISDGTSNNILIPFVNSGGVSFVTVISGGVTSASLNTGAVTVGAVAKHVSAYQTDSFAATLNGAVPTVDTSGAVPLNGNTMNIGWAAPYGGLYLNGRIRNIRFIPARAADFQLQGLTT